MLYQSKKNGFIALMSAIVVSAILLVVVVGASMTGITARFNMLDAESKVRSAALADACADTILDRLGSNSAYVGPETVTVGGDSCQILGTANGTADPRIFEIQASLNNAYTNALVSVGVNSLTIDTWQEVGHF